MASRAEQLQQDRDRIRRSDPIGVLIAVAQGKPLAKLDWEGGIIDFERPSMDHRIVAARELVKKIAPDLRSVDVTANEGAGLTFIIDTSVPLPGSQKRIAINGDQVIDHIAQHIEHGDD